MKVEAIATVMRRIMLEWFGQVKRRDETENIRAVAEMKMEGKRPRGRPKLRWNDTLRKPGTSRSNGPLTEKDGKVSARPATPNSETATKCEKGENVSIGILLVLCLVTSLFDVAASLTVAVVLFLFPPIIST